MFICKSGGKVTNRLIKTLSIPFNAFIQFCRFFQPSSINLGECDDKIKQIK